MKRLSSYRLHNNLQQCGYLVGFALLICIFLGSRTPSGLRISRWLRSERELIPYLVKTDLRHPNYEMRLERVKQLHDKKQWKYFQDVLPLLNSTNFEVARTARWFVDDCLNMLRFYGWREYSWGFETSWGRIYTSNYLANSALDIAADGVVSNYIEAMQTTNWTEIKRLSQSGSIPGEPWAPRDRERFFIGSPSTFIAQRRLYTENELELEGIGSFPSLVTGLVPTVFVLLPEDNAWKISSIRFDIPDEVADEFFRDN